MKPSAPPSAGTGAPLHGADRSRLGQAFRGKALQVIGWTLFVGAVAYLATSVRSELGEVLRNTASVGALAVAAAIMVSVLTLLFQAGYHALLLERLSGVNGQRPAVVSAYLQGQVVRYLPGKIWGMIFQSQRLSNSHAPVFIVIANLWQTVMTSILSAGIVASVIAGYWLHPAWLLGTLPTLLVVEWMHRRPALEGFILHWLSRWLPSLASLDAMPAIPRLPWRGTLLLLGEWITFIATFCVLLQGVTGMLQAALLGVWYAGASLLAMAAVAVPAGLAVREAIFLAIPDAVGLDTAALLTTAVLARVVQVSAELFTALAAGPILGRRTRD